MKFKSRYMLCELWRYQCVICEGKGDLQIYKVIRAPHILFLSTSNVSGGMACVRECVDGNSTVLSIYDHHHYQPDHRLDDDDRRLDHDDHRLDHDDHRLDHDDHRPDHDDDDFRQIAGE